MAHPSPTILRPGRTPPRSAGVVREANGFAVLLDGERLTLPSGRVLLVRTDALARGIAAEWRAMPAGGPRHPAALPLSELAATAQDRIAPDPAAMIAGLLRIAQSDLLCYRVAQPASLAAAQEAAGQPWLDWAEGRFGARLEVATSLTPIDQPEASLAGLRAGLEALSPEVLAGLGIAVPGLGSCVLGLALAEGAIEPAAAVAVASLEEQHREAQWGDDPACAAERAALLGAIQEAVRFMQLSQQG